ncbi:MAG: prepilin-type N-terminal cleavage/methylation domain-containing protein, partial [Candidatus Magasanikbacteria bacterium]|nr:prepilin-type N-terminal cleavage/methylation domain-containing protein [Candidatus Magasanikbacteria bacterium]
MISKIKHKGFTLVEIVVALGVFLLFASGIYSGIQFVFKSVYYSRLKILETGILNEQLEIIRNLPFEDVGIVNGSPSGVLERTATTTRNNIDFEITRTIRNIDDPFDGTIGGTPNDLAPADYKMVEVEIICTNCYQTK